VGKAEKEEVWTENYTICSTSYGPGMLVLRGTTRKTGKPWRKRSMLFTAAGGQKSGAAGFQIVGRNQNEGYKLNLEVLCKVPVSIVWTTKIQSLGF
jgi:hypothetical protein